MNLKLFIVGLLGVMLWGTGVAQTIPVHGTWVNLPYQDVRNKYMNPGYLDYTSPAFWKAKINEQADLGLKYIVIMAVANEGRSYYPSSFMQPAYAEGQQSPVEAILEAAEQRNLKVFMSCGWAVSQDDDLKDPVIRNLQLRIMEETGRLFGKIASFYGWYLPVEDSMEPVLSDHAVDAVNFLTAKARSVTPGKKIMISPYGLCHADIDNPVFGKQISKLKVDIIAYQDEVGCVREPQPLPRMKENFSKLRKIHNQNGIAFWANVESFTWEKEDNSRSSALIPAAFPRYLSQMVGVSKAGVDEVISFSTFGIYESSASPFPIGQPRYSNQVQHQLRDWLTGDARWKILERTFSNEVKGEKILSIKDGYGRNRPGLFNGLQGQENDTDPNWLFFEGEKGVFTVTLNKKTNIQSLAIRFLNYMPHGIALPAMVHLFTSKDNKNFFRIRSICMDRFPNNRFDSWIDIAYFKDLNLNEKYLKIEFDGSAGYKMACDEVYVNPK